MSLDVSLTVKVSENKQKGCGVFVRENGDTREITRAEWEEKFPGCEPILFEIQFDDKPVYDANIMHNLGRMAGEAGIYQHLWHPDEINITKANELIEPLTAGLSVLKNDPERFKKLNPSNGWGCYEDLVRFVEDYLDACIRFPQSEILISR